ncbi:MAG: phosphoglycerate kinase, partial [Acidobacteria bacterium]|nr:phosphoglycerate kinase [Acidobacteriota bacterium]
IIASHFGRPKGKAVPDMSLRPVRGKLAELTGREVQWASDCVGTEAREKSQKLEAGEILLLENLRYHSGEEANDEEFATRLASLAEAYVNDAFGASHRAHASIYALPRHYGADASAAGLLLVREIEFLQKVVEVDQNERPFVAILGGAKIKGKIEPLEAMIRVADHVLIGGGMANTFLAAQGVEMGSSLVDRDSVELAGRLLEEGQDRIELPSDLVVTDSIDEPTVVETVSTDDGVPPSLMAVDVGPVTAQAYEGRIATGKTVFWNGPMGVFEKEAFSSGTMKVAGAIGSSRAVSIVGGGESVEAIKASGFADRITHISTGGGASLEFISGAQLPGVEVLRKGS